MRTISEIKADIAANDGGYGDEPIVVSRWLEYYQTITNSIPLDRLEQICEAEREGRAVVLPYPIGTKLYYFNGEGVLKGHIQEITVHGYSESAWQGSMNKGKDHRFIICHNSYNEPHAYQIRNAYPTREQAEAALQKEASHERD